MRVLVVLAHPRPGSLNHAIAARARTMLQELGHEVVYLDLYAEGFDPILPAEEVQDGAVLEPCVERDCRELAEADGVVIVHPNWWGQPPAILKGWVDRTFRPGLAYRFLEGDGGEGVPVGLLRAKAVVVFNTSNTAAAREDAAFGDPLERLWRDCIFGLCGVADFHRATFRVVITSSREQRRAWLDDVANTMARVFPAEGQG